VLVVDGLGRLPPLRLKLDVEIASQQTPNSRPEAAPTPTSSASAAYGPGRARQAAGRGPDETVQKTFTGVVSSLFGMLRALLPGGPGTPATSAEGGEGQWKAMRPAFGLLSRESGFAFARPAVSLPGRPPGARTTVGSALADVAIMTCRSRYI
jgi:hypothetical protein